MAIQRARVEGLSALNQVLKQLPPRVQRTVLQQAVNAGGRVSLNAIKAAAPSGWAGATERRQSPASRRYGPLKENLAIQTMRRIRATARGVRIWTRNAFWGNFYELGTSRQPARPFMRPAFARSGAAALDRMRAVLLSGLEREAARLAGSYRTAKKSLGIR